MKHESKSGDFTKCVHAGHGPEKVTGAVMVPVFQTSTYAQSAPGVHSGFEYARTHNPTRDALEKAIAELEGAAYGISFASGLAAMTTMMLSLPQGSHIIVGDDVYGGTARLFRKVLNHLKFTFVDGNKPETWPSDANAVWMESPTNPMLKVIDLKKAAQFCEKKSIPLWVDNTFCSPMVQKPLEFGAHAVIHSTTKYIGGHSDVVGGTVVTSDPKFYEKMKYLQNAVGAVPGPWDCFLTLRGLKTLAVRMQQHCKSALEVAQWLEKQPFVEKVLYPGLETHPDYKIACQQMKGFGGMISFYLKSGYDGSKFCSSTKVFTLAESLGGVESLIEIPSIMTHGSLAPEIRKSLGITDSLIRLSVGIEDTADTMEDLSHAAKLAKG